MLSVTWISSRTSLAPVRLLRTQRRSPACPGSPWRTRHCYPVTDHGRAARHDVLTIWIVTLLQGIAKTSEGGTVRFMAETDLGLNLSSGMNNVNHLTVSYRGPGAITSLVFNPEGTAATAGKTTGGNNGPGSDDTTSATFIRASSSRHSTKAFTLGISDLRSLAISSCLEQPGPAAIDRGSAVDDVPVVRQRHLHHWKAVRLMVGHGPQHDRQVTNGTGPDAGVTSTSFVMPIFRRRFASTRRRIGQPRHDLQRHDLGRWTFSGAIGNRR